MTQKEDFSRCRSVLNSRGASRTKRGRYFGLFAGLFGVFSSPSCQCSPASTSVCGPEVPGVKGLLKPGTTLILGESGHGTREMPDVFGDLVCRAATAGLRVSVGLEFSSQSTAGLDAFLVSAGTDSRRRQLLQNGEWRTPYPRRENQLGDAGARGTTAYFAAAWSPCARLWHLRYRLHQFPRGYGHGARGLEQAAGVTR